MLLCEVDILRRCLSGGRAASAEEATDGVADGRSDCDTAIIPLALGLSIAIQDRWQECSAERRVPRSFSHTAQSALTQRCWPSVRRVQGPGWPGEQAHAGPGPAERAGGQRWRSDERAQEPGQRAWRGQPSGGEGGQILRVDEAFWMRCEGGGVKGNWIARW